MKKLLKMKRARQRRAAMLDRAAPPATPRKARSRKARK